MSIATDVRTYADTALAQGKTYADTALAQGKTALTQASTVVASANKRLITDAPKPAYAALGAADLVASTVTKRVEALPTGAAQSVGKAQQTSRTLLTRSQDDASAKLTELRARLDVGLGTVIALPIVAKNTTEAYLSTAKDLYGKLTARGEAKAGELLKDSRVSKLLGQVSEAADTVQGTVSPVVKSAFDAVQSVSPVEAKPVRKAPAARKPAAKKAAPVKRAAVKATPAKRTATKSTAAKSTARKSTATKSTAAKSTARKSAAAKSTATKPA
jgi:hypothetical protein